MYGGVWSWLSFRGCFFGIVCYSAAEIIGVGSWLSVVSCMSDSKCLFDLWVSSQKVRGIRMI